MSSASLATESNLRHSRFPVLLQKIREMTETANISLQAIDKFRQENEQLKREVSRLKKELALLQELGRNSSPPF